MSTDIQLFSSGLLQTPVPDMTYNVFSGTLNLTQPCFKHVTRVKRNDGVNRSRNSVVIQTDTTSGSIVETAAGRRRVIRAISAMKESTTVVSRWPLILIDDVTHATTSFLGEVINPGNLFCVMAATAVIATTRAAKIIF